MSLPNGTSNSAANRPSKYRIIARVTWINALVNALLSLAKIAAGLIFHSAAMLADGIHSLSDLLTDAMVLWLNRIAGAPPDGEHPYGHARFETLGTLIMGGLLLLVAIGLANDIVQSIWQQEQQVILAWPLFAVAVVMILAKEGLYHYSRHYGLKVGSQLLLANAWHSRSDVFSSLVVLLGLLGALAGLPWLEPLAALVVVALIGKMALGLIYQALQEFLDRGLDKQELQNIEQIIMQVPGVLNAHEIRTRVAGGNKVFLDLHLCVDAYATVSEGHHLGDQVVLHLQQQMPELADITVHIDVHQGEEQAVTLAPNRQLVLKELQQGLRLTQPCEAILHYLPTGLEAWIILKAPEPQASALSLELVERLGWLSDIRLLCLAPEQQ